MSAAGRVCTGFSLPYVAKYSCSTAGVVSYSNGQKLARGVEVQMDINSSDDNKFYADNVQAEQVGGKFQDGTIKLTVDGLLDASEKFLQGLSTSSVTVSTGVTVTVYAYDQTQDIPYVGVGYVARYLSDGVTSYEPCIVTKAKFQMPKHNAKTEEDSIEFQTQELTANLFRDDSANGVWFEYGEAQTTEAKAEQFIKKVFSIT